MTHMPRAKTHHPTVNNLDVSDSHRQVPQTGQGGASRLAGILLPAAVALAALIVFGRVVRHAFLTWDDLNFLVHNDGYRGLGWANLRYAFTAAGTFGYLAPVTWLSYTLDWLTSGVSPRGVHTTSLILHAASAVMFYAVARRLLARALPSVKEPRPWAALAALLFALHPLRVEPVAWACGRGYLLAGLFFLLTLWCYLRYVDATQAHGRSVLRIVWLIAAVACMLLSVFAVPVAVGLPLVLLVLDAYPLRRFSAVGHGSRTGEPGRPRPGGSTKKMLLEKLPFLAVAILAVALAPLAKSSQGSLTSTYSIATRAAIAAYSIAHGPATAVLPLHLSPLYQLYPDVRATEPRFIIAAIAVLLITAAAIRLRRRCPAVVAAWTCYLVLVLPVCGIVQYGLQITADRYTYIACMGLAILAAGLAAWAYEHRPLRPTVIGLSVAAAIALGYVSHAYAGVWRDSKSLWTRAVQLDGRSYTALNNLGVVLQEEGQLAEAAKLFRRAYEAFPEYPPLRNNLGHIAAIHGRLDAAIEHYAAYLQFRPHDRRTRLRLATVLARRGWVADAIGQIRLVEQPAISSTLYAILSGRLVALGHDDVAIQVTRTGLTERPNDLILLNNRAWFLATSWDPACRNGTEAVVTARKLFDVADRQHVQRAQFYATLAAALAEAGQFADALPAIDRAIALAPSSGQNHLVAGYEQFRDEFRRQKPHHEPKPPPSPWLAVPLDGMP